MSKVVGEKTRTEFRVRRNGGKRADEGELEVFSKGLEE